jgi:hypothetical protein
MGILDSIKNYVTGGAADVRVIVKTNDIILGSNVDFEISATPTESTVAASKIYIKIEALEESGDKNVLYKSEQEVDSNVQLTEGETKQWTATFQIPVDAQASFYGRSSKLQWIALAGIDMAGIDPKSEEVVFMVNNPALEV